MSHFVIASVDIAEEDFTIALIQRAQQMADAENLKLAVITVVPDYGMSIVGSFFPNENEKEVMDKVNQRLHEIVKKALPKDYPVKHIVGHGSAYQEVLQFADEIDAKIIVVGAHKPGLKDYILGPNAARIVRYAKASVYVMRDGG